MSHTHRPTFKSAVSQHALRTLAESEGEVIDIMDETEESTEGEEG